jgi:hypothetical protein
MFGPWWDRRRLCAELKACYDCTKEKDKGLRSTIEETLAAHGGSQEYSGRPRRCSAGKHAPRALSTSPLIGWAPPRARSSPPRPAGSNDLVDAEEPVTQLGRASVDLHGSKSVSAFARDDFYIGQVYEAKGQKVRSRQRRREGRCEGAIQKASCGRTPFAV